MRDEISNGTIYKKTQQGRSTASGHRRPHHLCARPSAHPMHAALLPSPLSALKRPLQTVIFIPDDDSRFFFFCKIGYTTNQNTKCKPAIEFRSYALFNALVVRHGFESRRGQNFDQTMLAIEVLRTTESRTTISAANQMARRQNASGQRHLTAGQRHPESG